MIANSKSKDDYEITVLVCSYNPRINALFFTLDSVINQKNINLEIIITDDGSKNSLALEIEDYFKRNNFSNWKMVCNKRNKGTVHNLYSGLLVSSGKYIKIISPGDALYGDNTLRKWLDFTISNNYSWTFSDALYYYGDITNMTIVSVDAHPNNIRPYVKKEKKSCIWNYVVWDDIATGATMLCKKDIQIFYTKKLLDKVIYAEDNMWRLMMFDGIVGGYYPKNTMFYEYGTGISTRGSTIWDRRILDDWNAATKIMLDKKELTDLQKKIIKALKLKVGGIFQRVRVDGYISRKFNKYKRRKTNNSLE